VSDEKALDDSLADFTDKLIAQSKIDTAIPPEIAEEAKLAVSLQKLIAPEGKPSPQMRQQLSLRLSSAFDANEREKIRRKRLPFFRRYPLASAAAALVIVVMGIALFNLDSLTAGSEVGTADGNLDSLTIAILVGLGIIGLLLVYFLQRRK
jgi:hypothetical protein